jgi:hypothetical protein
MLVFALAERGVAFVLTFELLLALTLVVVSGGCWQLLQQAMPKSINAMVKKRVAENFAVRICINLFSRARHLQKPAPSPIISRYGKTEASITRVEASENFSTETLTAQPISNERSIEKAGLPVVAFLLVGVFFSEQRSRL